MKHFSVGVAIALACASAGAKSIQPFSLEWMNSSSEKTYRSGDHKNAVFVVEAYFLGCHFCNDNAPQVDKLAKKYQSQPRVQVLDVGIDTSDSEYAEWIHRHHPNHPVLKDASRTLIHQLGTSGYPSTYVIGTTGNVIEETSGAWSPSKLSRITAAIDKALARDELDEEG